MPIDAPEALAQAAYDAVTKRPSIDPSGVSGLLDEFGGTVGSNGWNALVAHTYGGIQYLTWIEQREGAVQLVEAGTDEGARSGTDLVNELWDAAKAGQ